jgi:hypothetical protein
MTLFSLLSIFVLALISNSASGNVLAPKGIPIFDPQLRLLYRYHIAIDLEGCGGSIFVEDAVVIDAPLSANCKWQIKTDENHVLVFTVVPAGGNFKQIEEFLSVIRILNFNC